MVMNHMYDRDYTVQRQYGRLHMYLLQLDYFSNQMTKID